MSRIAQLPEASGVNGADLVPIVQGGVTKRVTADKFTAGMQEASDVLDALAAVPEDVGFLTYDGGSLLRKVNSTAIQLLAQTTIVEQRAWLGLGTAALKDAPASGNAASGETVLGSDTRLSNARTPTSHTHVTGDITGLGTAAVKNVPASGNAAVGEVVLGSDTRLTNTRAPSVHKTSHATGGADALTASDIGAAAASHTHVTGDITGLGTAAVKNVPASGNAAVGEVVLGSDSRLSDARTPASHTHTLASITDAGTAAAKSVPSSGDASAGQVVLGSDSRLTDDRDPTAHKTSHATGGADALTASDIGAAAASHTHVLASITDAGSAASKNAPTSGNATVGQVVLGSDSRLTDSRAPSTHKASHATGGADPLSPSDIGAAAAAHKANHATGGSDALSPADIGAATSSHTHTPASIGAADAVHTHVVGDISDAGTMATQNASAVAITGGTITGVAITASSIEGIALPSHVAVLGTVYAAADTITSSTSEIQFASSVLIAANTLATGDSVHIVARGIFTTTSASSQTLQFRLYAAGTALIAFPAIAMTSTLTNEGWELEADLIVTGAGPTNDIDVHGVVRIVNNGTTKGSIAIFGANASLKSVVLSSANSILISTQWGATIGLTSASLRQLIVTRLQAP